MIYDDVFQAAQTEGLLVMGALYPDRVGAAELIGGTLMLLGAGPEFWPAFSGSVEAADGAPDPIDRWSRRVVGALADRFAASAHFPFGGPPYRPFIDWALKSGRAFLSPTGMLVHDSVGLMISYRGALHFDREIGIPHPGGTSPCPTCDAPCTRACPVGALSAGAPYDLTACHGFLDTGPGQACMQGGCAARLACPLSAGAGRRPAQSALHMAAFHPT